MNDNFICTKALKEIKTGKVIAIIKDCKCIKTWKTLVEITKNLDKSQFFLEKINY